MKEELSLVSPSLKMDKTIKFTFCAMLRNSIQRKVFHFESADEVFGVSEHRLSGKK